MNAFEKFTKLSTGLKFLVLAAGGAVLLAVKEWSSKRVRNSIDRLLGLNGEDDTDDDVDYEDED